METLAQYTFKELQKLCKQSDENNPKKREQINAERILIELGFYEKDGAIITEFPQGKTTYDGHTLEELSEWFEEYFC